MHGTTFGLTIGAYSTVLSRTPSVSTKDDPTSAKSTEEPETPLVTPYPADSDLERSLLSPGFGRNSHGTNSLRSTPRGAPTKPRVNAALTRAKKSLKDALSSSNSEEAREIQEVIATIESLEIKIEQSTTITLEPDLSLLLRESIDDVRGRLIQLRGKEIHPVLDELDSVIKLIGRGFRAGIIPAATTKSNFESSSGSGLFSLRSGADNDLDSILETSFTSSSLSSLDSTNSLTDSFFDSGLDVDIDEDRSLGVPSQHPIIQAQETYLPPSEKLDLKSKVGVLKMLEAIYRPIKETEQSAANNRIKALIVFVEKMPEKSEQQTATDWATVSLELEALITEINNISRYSHKTQQGSNGKDKYTHHDFNGLNIDLVRKNISNLVLISGAAWAQRAHEEMVQGLTEIYHEKFDPAHSELAIKNRAVGGQLSVPILGEATILGTYGNTAGTLVDDELFPAEMNLGSGGVDLSADIPFAAAGTDFTISRGTYEEWSSARKYVLARFDELVAKHSKEIFIASNRSREACLGRPPSKDLGNSLFSRLTPSYFLSPAAPGYHAPNTFDMERFNLLNRKYEDNHEHMARMSHFLLQARYKSMEPTIQPPCVETEPPGIALHGLNIEASDGIKLKMTQYANKSKGVLGLGGQKSTIGPGSNIFQANLSANVDFTESFLAVVKNTSLCRALDGDLVTGARLGPEKIALVRNEILKKSEGIRKKLDADVRNTNQKIRESATAAAMDIARENKEHYSPFKIATSKETHWARPEAETGKLSVEKKLSLLDSSLKELRRDFDFYTTLNKQLSYGDPTTKFSIDAFQKKYGAGSKEETLYRLLLLNASIYAQAIDLGKESHVETFKKQVSEFEAVLSKPAFEVDLRRVEELVSFKEETFLEMSDKKISASAQIGLGPATTQSLFWGHIGISYLFRKRVHVNPLRSGAYQDIELKLGAVVNIGSKAEIIKIIMTKFCNKEILREIPNLVDVLNEQLTEEGLQYAKGADKVFTIRLFKPQISPTGGFRRLYNRITNAIESNFGGVIPFLPVTAGFSFATTRNSFSRETISTSSIIYLMMRYFHEYAIGNLDKDGRLIKDIRNKKHRPESDAKPGSKGGKLKQNPTSEPKEKLRSAYWDRLVMQQEDKLKALFKQIGRPVGGSNASDGIIQELNDIEALIGMEDWAGSPRQKFLSDAWAFSAGEEGHDYATVLRSFEKLMYEYCGPLLAKKRSAEPYKQKEFQLEATDSVIDTPSAKTWRWLSGG